ncbi:MAG: hypothetical protein ACKOW9_04295 [Candidatus Paceibacterota bacterium]
MEGIHKDNLHHAYLLLGSREDNITRILGLIGELSGGISNNPDFLKIEVDTFRIADARTLKAFTAEKSFTENARKFIVLSARHFLEEAQNTLLKVFEEPSPGIHFFILAENTQGILPTLLSRMYTVGVPAKRTTHAQEFLAMDLAMRFEYIKGILTETDEDDLVSDSPRTKALNLLNDLEETLYVRFLDGASIEPGVFGHIFKVRENLRQSGSAPKMLIESVALAIPVKI